jgi:para-nitrobenzyl esterase
MTDERFTYSWPSCSVKFPRLAARLSLVAFAAMLAAPYAAAAQTLISIDDGDVQGQLNGVTREFLGIPFAAPPVSALRWRPPAPVVPWVGTLDATTYSSACAQLPSLTGTPSENEDCLYLNVWTPEPAPAEPLPVMVWIHGGSNVAGSTGDGVPFPGYDGVRLYSGHVLAGERNVVVVTVNYRLGVFGFYGHSDLEAEDGGFPYAGNQGLLDQRQALQWVQSNIAAFGGDPENVTIFGESAGSFDVCAHVVSPMSAGLFHRAISQSGGCSVGVRTAAVAATAADTISATLGCDVAPDELACLRAASVTDVLDAAGSVPEGSEADLGISIDGGFLPDNPRTLLDTEQFSKVPYILGANLDEGTLFFIGTTPITTDAEYQAELFTLYGAYAPEVAALYPSAFYPTPQDALIRVFGDSRLVCSTLDVAQRVADASKTRVYAYSFEQIPGLPFINLLNLGAFHGLEIAYVFGTIPPPSAVDADVGQRMREFWTRFAERGRPKATATKGWPRFKTKTWKMIRHHAFPSKLKDYSREECEFWSGVYEAGGF